jgi:hypothetical protein
MGSLRDQRKKLKGAAPASQSSPKLGEGLVEPRAPSVPPAAAVPKAAEEPSPQTARSTPAPAQEPEPEATRPEAVVPPQEVSPKPVARTPSVPKAPAPAPRVQAPAPAEPEETAQRDSSANISSGELIVDEQSEPPVSSKPPSVLGDILAGVPEPDAAQEPVLPDVAEAPRKATPPPMPVADPKKAEGTAAFDSEGESFLIKKTGYRLVYEGMASATACKFALVGKETLRFDLYLSSPETVNVESADGQVSITLVYNGTNEKGKKEVEFEVEGGVSTVAKKAAQVRKAGSAAGAWLASLKYHVPEIISGTMITAVTVGLATLETVRSQLGSLTVPAAIAYGVIGAAVTGWAALERRKDIRKLEESNAGGE